jgi:hypothetical protein
MRAWARARRARAAVAALARRVDGARAAARGGTRRRAGLCARAFGLALGAWRDHVSAPTPRAARVARAPGARARAAARAARKPAARAQSAALAHLRAHAAEHAAAAALARSTHAFLDRRRATRAHDFYVATRASRARARLRRGAAAAARGGGGSRRRRRGAAERGGARGAGGARGDAGARALRRAAAAPGRGVGEAAARGALAALTARGTRVGGRAAVRFACALAEGAPPPPPPPPPPPRLAARSASLARNRVGCAARSRAAPRWR